MSRLLARLVWSFAVAVCLCDAGSTTAAPKVWTGLANTFARTAESTADHITDLVALTRGTSGGIYNSVVETFFDNAVSPADTEWATDRNNAEANIAAANWSNLHFDPWAIAYGPQPGMNVVGRDAVLHLISDDIYLDIRFSQWATGGGGGGGSTGTFTYLRAGPTGDYNGDHVIDASDFVAWRNTYGQLVAKGDAADGNASGMIDAGDYSFWASRFGNVIATAASPAAVPEPATVVFLLVCLCAVRRWRCYP
jgi:hypothetical protein